MIRWSVLVVAGCGRLGFDARAVPDDGSPIADTPAEAPPPPNSVTVTIDGVGRVVSEPAGIDCPGSCSAVFDGPVELVANAASPDRFLGWESGTCATVQSCNIVPGPEPVAVSARFTGTNNVAFVTSTVHPAPGLSPSTADGICNARAMEAGLPGRFVALLSIMGDRAVDRIGGADGWLAMDGLPIAEFRTDLIGGAHRYALRLDERQQYTSQIVWTGTHQSGDPTDVDCAGWTSASATASFGVSDAVGAGFINTSSGLGCDMPHNLYCAGVDKDGAPPVLAHAGRLAFLSTPWTPGDGLASADEHCQGDAEAAGVTGTFKALLYQNGASPQSRFDLAKPTWVRRDGLRLFRSADELGGSMLTALRQRADASYSDEQFSFSGDFMRSCSDWMATTGVVGGGQIQRAAAYLGTYGADCSMTLPLLCFED